MKTKPAIAAGLAMLILSACNLKKNEKSSVNDIQLAELKAEQKTQDKPSYELQSPQTLDSVGTAAPPPATGNPAASVDWDKKIIKTGTLKLEVKNFRQYNDAVHKTIKQFGAYIAQEEQHYADDKIETVVSIKVPVAQFEDMLNSFSGDSTKTLERKISTDDVTAEVVDTKARLESKKQMRLKYLEFLKQSKNMEEVLKVQQEIDDMQAEIEGTAGRINYLSHAAAFSTIELTFFQPLTGVVAPRTDPGFFTSLGSAFKNGLSWFETLIIGLTSIWPLVLITLIGIFMWRKMRPFKAMKQNV